MITLRTVVREECPWLSSDIPAGTQVYLYKGCTYGCIGSGFAATFSPEGGDPFFELPCDCVEQGEVLQ